MGWVVSKSLKENFNENEEIPSNSESVNFGTIIPIESFNRNVNESNNSPNEKFNPPPRIPTDGCDILMIDHEIEYFSTSNSIKSLFTNAESLYSIPVEINNLVELNSKVVEGNLTNIALISTNNIMMCPAVKKKSTKSGKTNKNDETKSHLKSRKSKQSDQIKKAKNDKIMSLRTFPKKLNSNLFKCQIESENDSSRLFVTRHKIELIKPLKKAGKIIPNKKQVTKNYHQILPSLNRNSRKHTPSKLENKTLEQQKAIKKSSNFKFTNIENIKIKDENSHRNSSPATLDDREKQLFANNFLIDDTESTINRQRKDSFTFKKRPATAFSISNNSQENFNRKLEKLMKENYITNCLCNNYNKETNLKNKATVRKITFFFLKKYGNFGKFVIARLNEFLDNVYYANSDQKATRYCHKTIGINFPLPCNANDIEYEGDLKPYDSFLVEDFISKSKISKSKLPKLIQQNNNKFLIHNENNERKYVKKIKFKNQNNENKASDLNTILPPLKPASSVMNFCRTSNFDKTNLVHQTLDLSSEQYFSGLLNIFYDENIVQSCARESELTNDIFETI